MGQLEHIHLTVNAKIDQNFSALPKEDAQRFVDKLLKAIDMKPLGPLNWADAEDLDFPGQSFVQMITTSHCSLHFFDNKEGEKEIYFDLYSCRGFSPQKVLRMLDRKFSLGEWHGMLYKRARGEEPEIIRLGTNAQEMAVIQESC